MSAPTLDDALDETACDRACLVTVEFRVDPAWSREQMADHLFDTFLLTLRRITEEMA